MNGVALGVPVTEARQINGLAIGLGAAADRGIAGVGLAPIGLGAGDHLRGIMIAGLGGGTGGEMTGLGFGGLGLGSEQDLAGLTIGGIGVGTGTLLEGIAISLGAVGAPTAKGAVFSTVAGGERMTCLVLAPAYLEIESRGRFTGFSASAFNHIKGEQHGLVIGIFNYAKSLHSVQIGVLNYAGNNRKGLRLLPLVNAHTN